VVSSSVVVVSSPGVALDSTRGSSGVGIVDFVDIVDVDGCNCTEVVVFSVCVVVVVIVVIYFERFSDLSAT